jgi:hypothetical protein
LIFFSSFCCTFSRNDGKAPLNKFITNFRSMIFKRKVKNPNGKILEYSIIPIQNPEYP